MVSILGYLLPEKKQIRVALKQIYGLGNFRSNQICEILGFDPNLKKMDAIEKNKLVDFKIDGVKYKVPSFLFNDLIPEHVDHNLIRSSLIFTRSIINNKFFLPNNLIFPKSRIILENYFN